MKASSSAHHLHNLHSGKDALPTLPQEQQERSELVTCPERIKKYTVGEIRDAQSSKHMDSRKEMAALSTGEILKVIQNY